MENRQYFRPKANKVYTNKNGSQYRCLSTKDEFNAEMIHTTSKWRFEAIGCQMYDDGMIEWDCSTGGYFDENTEETKMKKTYLVSFRHSENVYCTNIVITDDAAKIEEEYSKNFKVAKNNLKIHDLESHENGKSEGRKAVNGQYLED